MKDISPEIQKLAPVILDEIKKANNILLHCHPSPDPDSVGSALAMKFALEQMGKKATVIRGDSEIPEAFAGFPGSKDIVQKSFLEINQEEFDLFLVLDCSTTDRITRNFVSIASPDLRLVNIDHHRSNESFGAVNLVVPDYPATAQVLFDLFSSWGIELTADMATCLFVGIYTDTGGLRYRGTTPRTFKIMAALVEVIPNFSALLDEIDNSKTPGSLAYLGMGLTSTETFLGGKVAVASISYESMKKAGITERDMDGVKISSFLRSVVGWDLDIGLVETELGVIKAGFRTRDADRFDVSKIAVALGGGGHKAAAGAILRDISIAEAKELVVSKAKELYNL